MSTTSDVSSNCGDWIDNNNNECQCPNAMATIGAVLPLPVANFARSPLFLARNHSRAYKDIDEVVNAYQLLLDGSNTTSLSTRLDFLWVGFSQELFQLLSDRFNYRWELVLIADFMTDAGVKVPATVPIGYEQLAYNQAAPSVATKPADFTEKAKVRFRCECKRNDWTSMQGRAEFWFVNCPYDAQRGVVFFRLFNQQCKKCNREANVLWFPDEVVRVLNSLYTHLWKNVHNDPNPIRPIELLTTRNGTPKHGHLKQYCQACQAGICKNGPNSLPATKLKKIS